MITLYGIKNCDSVRKARRWLESGEVKYQFHDLRTDGVEPSLLQDWIEQLGWEKLLNRRSTTWRQLPDNEKTELDARKAAALMLQHPTLIKRPLLDNGSRCLAGFDQQSWQALLENR